MLAFLTTTRPFRAPSSIYWALRKKRAYPEVCNNQDLTLLVNCFEMLTNVNSTRDKLP
jgi:hypothetical protein